MCGRFTRPKDFFSQHADQRATNWPFLRETVLDPENLNAAALAMDFEGDPLWLIDVREFDELGGYGRALEVLWRSDRALQPQPARNAKKRIPSRDHGRLRRPAPAGIRSFQTATRTRSVTVASRRAIIGQSTAITGKPREAIAYLPRKDSQVSRQSASRLLCRKPAFV